eukprot:352362-Chlamydomonas_euryale.AAC.4
MWRACAGQARHIFFPRTARGQREVWRCPRLTTRLEPAPGFLHPRPCLPVHPPPRFPCCAFSQWTKLAGYSHLYKPRRVMVMDYFAAPCGDGSRPPPPRRQMWIHANAAAMVPRCRLWLDGAAAYCVGPAASEAILVRLGSKARPLWGHPGETGIQGQAIVEPSW